MNYSWRNKIRELLLKNTFFQTGVSQQQGIILG
jgi:hypothetical protein